MKIARLEYICEFLTEQNNHWSLFSLVLTVQGLAAGYTGSLHPNALLWLFCGAYPLIFFMLRERIKKILPFFLLHAAVLVLLSWAIPAGNGVERFLCVVCGVGYVAHSFSKRFSEGARHYTSPANPSVAVGLGIGGILFQHYQGLSGWDTYFVLTLAGVCALYLVISYLNNYMEFLSLNESSTGYLPAAEMLHSGLGLVLLYAGGMFVVLLLGSNLRFLAQAWRLIRSMLVAFFRRLFALLYREPEAAALEPEPTQSEAGTLMPEETGEPWLIWEILEVIFVAFLLCALIYGLYRGLVALVRFVRARFAQGFGGRMVLDQEVQIDYREKCDLEKRTGSLSGRRSLLAVLSPAERIRKMYKKKILASAAELTDNNTERLRTLTAGECGYKLNARDMAGIYDSVRYSDQVATSETLRRMKQAMKDIHYNE